MSCENIAVKFGCLVVLLIVSAGGAYGEDPGWWPRPLGETRPKKPAAHVEYDKAVREQLPLWKVQKICRWQVMKTDAVISFDVGIDRQIKNVKVESCGVKKTDKQILVLLKSAFEKVPLPAMTSRASCTATFCRPNAPGEVRAHPYFVLDLKFDS